jgi:hypothetical protein
VTPRSRDSIEAVAGRSGRFKRQSSTRTKEWGQAVAATAPLPRRRGPEPGSGRSERSRVFRVVQVMGVSLAGVRCFRRWPVALILIHTLDAERIDYSLGISIFSDRPAGTSQVPTVACDWSLSLPGTGVVYWSSSRTAGGYFGEIILFARRRYRSSFPWGKTDKHRFAYQGDDHPPSPSEEIHLS